MKVLRQTQICLQQVLIWPGFPVNTEEWAKSCWLRAREVTYFYDLELLYLFSSCESLREDPDKDDHCGVNAALVLNIKEHHWCTSMVAAQIYKCWAMLDCFKDSPTQSLMVGENSHHQNQQFLDGFPLFNQLQKFCAEPLAYISSWHIIVLFKEMASLLQH